MLSAMNKEADINKAFITDTAVKTSQKTVFFNHE
jgi:hypothetical protein